MPSVFVYFAATGIVAAALVGAGAVASALGNVIAEGSPAAIQANEQVINAYFGT